MAQNQINNQVVVDSINNQPESGLFVSFGVILIIGLAIAIIIYLLRKKDPQSRTNIDKWVEEKISKNLAEKLNRSTEDVLQAIRGSGNDEIIAMIQHIVASGTLTFIRSSSLKNIEMRLDFSYKNGTSFSVHTNWDWDALPKTIRSEFIRTDHNTVIRPWQFVWDKS